MVNIQLKVKLPWETMEVDEVRSYEEGTTAETILHELGIKAEDEGNFLMIINGKVEYKSYLIQDGDKISILSALIGG